MKPVAFVLIVIAFHLGVATLAASRQVLVSPTSIPLLGCDPIR